MSKTVLLQDSFTGSVQDTPRHQLPKGRCWMITDAIPDLWGGPLTKRGGWTRPFSTLPAGTYVAGVGYAPFSGGSRVLAVNDSGTLYRMTPGSATVTSVGAARVPAHPPTFYRDQVFIFDINGGSSPFKYDGTTLAAIGGSPPNGSVSTSFKDHLVTANSSANKNRVWFASAGNPDSWSTGASGQWLDCDRAIRGICTLNNSILVFEEGQTERIRGSVIPGVSGSDMVREPLFAVGCSDPASVVVGDGYAIFANSSGIYQTDGVGVANLTEQAGMLTYWRYQLANYATAWTIAGALFRGWYVFSVMDGATFKTAGMIHVQSKSWVTLTNLKCLMMAQTQIGNIDAGSFLWGADRSSLFVQNLSEMWMPGAEVAVGSTYTSAIGDGDGTDVTWSVETPFFYGSKGLKRWRHAYVSYKTGTGSDSASLTVSYKTQPTEYASYTALSPTLPEQSLGSMVRLRRQLGMARAEGIAIKVQQTNGTQSTQLFAIEADVWAEEKSKL